LLHSKETGFNHQLSDCQLVKKMDFAKRGPHGRREESVRSFGGKVRKKETTWKTKA
jgi:hypothetical protein